MPVLVSLTDDEVAEAKRLADATYALFKSRPGYYPNTPGSHLKGKLGEVAVAKWATALGFVVRPLFRDISLTNKEDVVIGNVRVEVKTWDHTTWTDMGRCVTPGQLRGLRRKADAIIWCSVDGSDVTLHGWSTVEEVGVQPVTMTGPEYRLIPNHQVPAGLMRPLEDLLALATR